ncbi:MAG: hypothetical protein IPN59_09215 [Holophaga sp.]|nr:hypothetical protein [Holophaga sp.]
MLVEKGNQTCALADQRSIPTFRLRSSLRRAAQVEPVSSTLGHLEAKKHICHIVDHQRPRLLKKLVIQFERAIKSLVRRFRNHPYAFYTESAMHCYLYHRLYSGGLVNGLYQTLDGHDTILLHKEYPTIARYHRQTDGKLKESTQGRRRGAFDISIWDPNYISDQEHRKQKVLCAAELAQNECRPGKPRNNEASSAFFTTEG